jgi:signal transduction histidine kinase
MLTATQEMEAAVTAASTPAEKALALNRLAEHLAEANPQRAIEVAKQLGQAASTLEDTSLYIKSLLNSAWATHNLADYAASLTQALEALKLARQHQDARLQYDALSIIGSNHQAIGNRPDALDAYMQALKLAHDAQNPLQIATIHNNIGLVYEGTGDFASALSYYQQARAAYDEANAHPALRCIAAANVAESHTHLGQYAAALAAAQNAAAIATAAGFALGEGLAAMHEGSALRELKRFQDADARYAVAMARFEDAGSTHQRAILLQSMAELELRKGNRGRGIELLQQALTIFESLQAPPSIFPVHKMLAAAYAQDGNFQQAYHHLEQFHTVRTRVFNEQADSREKTLQALYEVDKARLEAESQRHRNLALQKVIEQNEAIIDELDSYADNVAHDLKNPIALVIGFADLIQTDVENQLSATSAMSLEHLRAGADKLNEIVAALLSLAKARKQEIMPQPVHMTAVLREALLRLQSVIQRTEATIDAPEQLPACMGNKAWLEEALVNYIGNAMKYGGTPPHVRIDSIVEANGMVTYRVQDNGRGLTAEEQAKLFRKFERLGQHKIEGTGLGLMIVKTVVEKLGGYVGIQSSGIPGEGTTFMITLPSPPDMRP